MIGVELQFADYPKFYNTECTQCGFSNGIDWPDFNALRELGVEKVRLLDGSFLNLMED
jgi:hypothetical protein